MEQFIKNIFKKENDPVFTLLSNSRSVNKNLIETMNKEFIAKELENIETEIQCGSPFLTAEEAAQTIEFFNGCNINPLSFIESCETAYDKIHPLDIHNLTVLIRSKFYGKAEYILNRADFNFDDIILQIKRVFLPKEKFDFVNEMHNTEQKLYENPITFGKRILKILHFFEEIMNERATDKNSLSIDKEGLEKLAIEAFISKVVNNEIQEELKKRNPVSMIETLFLAENIWDCINARYLGPLFLLPTNNYNCLYCDRRYHYFDCPYNKHNLQMEYSVEKRVNQWNRNSEILNNIENQKEESNEITDSNLPSNSSRTSGKVHNLKRYQLLLQSSKLHKTFKNKLEEKLYYNRRTMLSQQTYNKYCQTCKHIKKPNSIAMQMRIQTFCPECSSNRDFTTKWPRRGNRQPTYFNPRCIENITSDLSNQLSNLKITKSSRKL